MPAHRVLTTFGARQFYVAALWALASFLLLAGRNLPPVWAQAGIEIADLPPPSYTFGETLTFELAAESGAAITEARVFYRTSKEPRTIAGEAIFDPGPAVRAQYVISLEARPLAPFAQVEYWWEVRDAAGGRLRTDPQTFFYEDNRFPWQTSERDSITVHWYTGDTAFGEAALDVAADALAQANRDIRAPLPAAINIYVYANAIDLQATLDRVGRAWVSGHADPSLGVVMVPAAPGLQARSVLERQIRHELTHLLIFTAAGDPLAYARVPPWLNEGLAALNQGPPDAELASALIEARDEGSLLPLVQLCEPFPAGTEAATLAYAESESVVRYLQGRFGSTRLAGLIARYADGADCEAGLRAELGLSLRALEDQWIRDVVKVNPAVFRLRALAPWMLITALVLAGAGGLFLAALGRPSPSSPRSSASA